MALQQIEINPYNLDFGWLGWYIPSIRGNLFATYRKESVPDISLFKNWKQILPWYKSEDITQTTDQIIDNFFIAKERFNTIKFLDTPTDCSIYVSGSVELGNGRIRIIFCDSQDVIRWYLYQDDENECILTSPRYINDVKDYNDSVSEGSIWRCANSLDEFCFRIHLENVLWRIYKSTILKQPVAKAPNEIYEPWIEIYCNYYN